MFRTKTPCKIWNHVSRPGRLYRYPQTSFKVYLSSPITSLRSSRPFLFQKWWLTRLKTLPSRPWMEVVRLELSLYLHLWESTLASWKFKSSSWLILVSLFAKSSKSSKFWPARHRSRLSLERKACQNRVIFLSQCPATSKTSFKLALRLTLVQSKWSSMTRLMSFLSNRPITRLS